MTSSRYQALRASQVRQRTGGWIRRRAQLFLPAYVVIVSLLSLSGHPWQRVVAAGAACLAVTVWWVVAARRLGDKDPGENALLVAGTISTGLYTVLCALSGGAASPLLPLLLGSPLGLFMLYGRGRNTNIAMGVLLAPLVLLLLLPDAMAGPRVPGVWYGLLATFSMLFTGIFVHTSAMLLVDIYQEAGQALDGMREELLLGSTRRSQAIESMGAKVAHELKNPLAAVKGLVQLLDKSAVDGRSRERLGVVISELARMESIIGDYLSFSRPLEALDARPVELGGLVDEVLAVLEARGREAGVGLTRNGAATVIGDGRRLKEALLNLVSNAVEASSRGGSVRVDVLQTQSGASVLVADTGEGISAEDLSRVGTPFFSRRDNGTGLGVVLARAAVTQHGGDLTFDSEKGRGTVVTLTLPKTPIVRENGHV